MAKRAPGETTELFEYVGGAYRILWDHQRILARKVGAVARWLKQRGYALHSRLRVPYALQVQQHFAARLTRVGTPVSPPVWVPVALEVYYKGNGDVWEALGRPIEHGAVVVHNPKGTQVTLTVACVNALIGYVGEVAERYKQRAGQVADGDPNATKKQERLRAKARDLEGCKTDWGMWLRTLNLFDLPGNGKRRELAPGLIVLYRNTELGGSSQGDVPVALNVNYGKEEEGATR